MLTCKTSDCSQKDTKHTPDPEGITVYCGVCGQELSADE